MKELCELRRELEAAVKPEHGAVNDRLFDLLEKQASRCERLEKENAQFRKRIAELEKQGPPQPPNADEPSQSYSLSAEEKRRRKRLRQSASKKRQAGRKANRTNKTDTGAIRQTHIVRVLESLRRSLDCFTIHAVVDRVASCLHRSIGMFQPTGPPEAKPALSPPG